METAEIRFRTLSVRLEYQWVGNDRDDAPIIVFLHEGLGSVSLWRDFPQRFCSALGMRGLVFSRYGYGGSTPRPEDAALPVSYLHDEAYEALPALLHRLGVERPWLFGHSDGGSIALLHAARFAEETAGIVVLAPHLFVEEITLDGIAAARAAYLGGDLRSRLGRHHPDPDRVFMGWNDAWLAPAFRGWNIEREVASIRCPVLALQGEGDEYGTLRQIMRIPELVPAAQAVALPDCGHTPHRDKPEEVIRLAGGFIAGHGDAPV
jgi:pimeloyl-ACP methyl ester carboxylesterase